LQALCYRICGARCLMKESRIRPNFLISGCSLEQTFIAQRITKRSEMLPVGGGSSGERQES
jgi:hypothetical protein